MAASGNKRHGLGGFTAVCSIIVSNNVRLSVKVLVATKNMNTQTHLLKTRGKWSKRVTNLDISKPRLRTIWRQVWLVRRFTTRATFLVFRGLGAAVVYLIVFYII